jgi:ATP-dependent DNA helicase RecG
LQLKSDIKKLPDRELVLAAVCLANTDGGTIWLGVEDDGRVTGLHPEHRDLTGLAAMIASRTVPPLSVRAIVIEHEGKFVGRLEIARSLRLIASSDGTLQRRRLLADGTPECVPFLPHEFPARESDLRLSDYSSLPVTGATLSALDALERQRLRQAIERYGGDRSLLGLDDEAFDGALGLTRTVDRVAMPTVTGLLLAGREAAIREHLPTHEAAFQLLSGTDVKVNDFYRWPLVRLFERLDEQVRAQVREQEVQVGLFRVSVPSVDSRAYREAVVNALAHRDYTRLGAVHVRWNDAELSISSPGGFVEGVKIARAIQRPPEAARVVIERLVEAGLVQSHGQTRGRTYTLSPSVYRKLGQDAGYVRQVGFDALQQEEMVKRYVREHGAIQRKDVVELCRLNDDQAKRLLASLTDGNVLVRVGQRKAARYEKGPNL